MVVGIPEFQAVKDDLRGRIIRHIRETKDQRAVRPAYSLEQGF